MGYPIQQANTTIPLEFELVSSSDHATGATGLTPTVVISKNVFAFAAPTGAVTEVGNGVYKVAANATDANTFGPVKLTATATGADPGGDTYLVVGYNAYDAVHLGVSALPNVAAGAAGGIATSTNSSGQPTVASVVAGGIAATDIQAGLTAQRYTSTRAGYLDTLSGLVAAIWGVATSALTNAGSIGKLLSSFVRTGSNVNANATNMVTLPSDYVTGTDVTNISTATAAAVLASPANKLGTDSTGRVTAANMVTLPSDYVSSTDLTNIATAVAAAILATPANKLATDSAGEVNLNLAQAVPATQSAAALNTLARAFQGAIQAAFGAESRSGATVLAKDEAGARTWRTFTLDSATNPTQRS